MYNIFNIVRFYIKMSAPSSKEELLTKQEFIFACDAAYHGAKTEEDKDVYGMYVFSHAELSIIGEAMVLLKLETWNAKTNWIKRVNELLHPGSFSDSLTLMSMVPI